MLIDALHPAGEDMGHSANIVFIRLVHYTGGERRIESLRFDTHDTYALNLASAQPWLNALVMRTRARLAREWQAHRVRVHTCLSAAHLHASMLSSTAHRILLVLITHRTQMHFHKYLQPLFDDCSLDYRIALIGQSLDSWTTTYLVQRTTNKSDVSFAHKYSTTGTVLW